MNLSSKNSGSTRVWPPREITGTAAGNVTESINEIKKEVTIMTRPSGAVIGAVAGLLFGMLTILYGFGAMLIMLLFAAFGAAIGWAVQGHLKGELDASSAWKALNRN